MLSRERQQKRKQIYNDIVEAFGTKYSWLGAQASRELLMSVASWNIEKHSDPPFRYRNHVMLAWERGWVKSTILRQMANLLGDNLCSTIGKVTDASMRGSVQSGKFMPPKPMKTPFVLSTEFGQTDFDDELLNLFLNMLEEGFVNISLNKIGSLPDSVKENVKEKYGGKVEFGEENEFELKCDFVFWGATYDPAYMQDDALRSRFQVVTPNENLDSTITKSMDQAPSVKSQLSKDTVKAFRREVMCEEEVKTNFVPTDHLYEKYNINPRESRDLHSYMAARNWWGLDVNPEVMENYIKHLKESRKIAYMTPEEQVFELIFDNPMTTQEIQDHTGFSAKELYKIVKRLDARPMTNSDGERTWGVYSQLETSGNGISNSDEDEDDDDDGLKSFGGMTKVSSSPTDPEKEDFLEQ